MESNTLPIYKKWLLQASPEDIQHVDQIYQFSEKYYEQGGSTIVECFSPEDILAEGWADCKEVLSYISLQNESAKNSRWGEDSDPELSLTL